MSRIVKKVVGKVSRTGLNSRGAYCCHSESRLGRRCQKNEEKKKRRGKGEAGEVLYCSGDRKEGFLAYRCDGSDVRL